MTAAGDYRRGDGQEEHHDHANPDEEAFVLGVHHDAKRATAKETVDWLATVGVFFERHENLCNGSWKIRVVSCDSWGLSGPHDAVLWVERTRGLSAGTRNPKTASVDPREGEIATPLEV